MTPPSAAHPVRIGLLGASKIAPQAVIAPATERDDVRITVVAARDPERARAYAEAHGIAAVADSYEALLQRDDVDLVYIALPPSAHLEWTLKAVQAGRPVLCEKPFAMNAGDARAMVDAAKAAGVPLIEAFHYRFHSVTRRAKALVADGAIGRPTRAKAYFNAPIPYSSGELRWNRHVGGGALMDLGCYPLHALRTLIGEEPTVVLARGQFDHGVDAGMNASLAFPSGVRAEIACSMIRDSIGCRLTVEGEHGKLIMVNFVLPQMGGRLTLTSKDDVHELGVGGPATYAAQLDHVVQVLAGRAAPLTGGDDAVRNMAAIDAIYAAAARASDASG